MNEELFIEVNKKRGLALEKAEEDMERLVTEGITHVANIRDGVKNVLTRFNLKKASVRDFNHDLPPFNEDDFALVEKTFNDLRSDTLIHFHCILLFRKRHRVCGSPLGGAINFTRAILKCLGKVKKYDNKIDSLITMIKLEEFSEDIVLAVYLIKGVLPFIIKTFKRIGVLYVQF